MENKYKSVTAYAPASVANVVCGFDIMGFSLGGVGDKVKVSISNNMANEVEITGKYASLIPSDRKLNTAGVAIDCFLNHFNYDDCHIKIELEKNLPLGSGLGSSASSAVAGLKAINCFFGNPLSLEDLIPFAMEGERIACGTAHADNVTASLFGGFVLIRKDDLSDYIKIECNDNLFACVVYPHIELKTIYARNVLSDSISINDAVKQSANAASFIYAIQKGNFELINRSMRDYIAEPQRQKLIPNFIKIKDEVIKHGALGFGISGSGPSVFALCKDEKDSTSLKEFIQNEFKEIGINSDGWISSLNAEGAKVLNTEN